MSNSTETTISSRPSSEDSPASRKDSMSVTEAILARHSTRAFIKSKAVPMPILHECLELARKSPSSTNHQPWRLYFLTGSRLETVRSTLMNAVESGAKSSNAAIPENFKKYRSELGHELYGEHGYNIPRSDKDGVTKASRRNFHFFDSPTVALVCIPRELTGDGHLAETMSVGLYTQTLVLLLTERGISTCWQVAPAGYGDLLKKEAGITDDVKVICTLDLGYEDPSQQINSVQARRDEWRDNVKFID